MKVVECPAVYRSSMFGDEFIPNNLIFLAGGITGCPDWQKEMIQRFKDEKHTVFFNPRRANFDINDKDASVFQINWERHHLNAADATLFWFPYHTLCPITLYELGVAAAKSDKMFVGCHPAYQRAFDVKQQLSLLRPEVAVHDNFADMVSEIKDWIAARDENVWF